MKEPNSIVIIVKNDEVSSLGGGRVNKTDKISAKSKIIKNLSKIKNLQKLQI